MKIIKEEQIKLIQDVMYQINAPVQIFNSVVNMLNGLPELPIKKDEKKTEEIKKDKTEKKVEQKNKK